MGNVTSIFTPPVGPVLGPAPSGMTMQLIAPGEVATASNQLAQVLPELRQAVGDQNASVVAVTNHLMTLSSWQARFKLVEAPTTATGFNRDISLLTASGEWVSATALLDTQCQIGNWISRRLIQEMGKLEDISDDIVQPTVFDANGNPVHAAGVITLTWRWQPRRQTTRTHHSQFYVFAESDHIDVVFGGDYITSHNLMSINEYAFLPMVTRSPMVKHKTFTKQEKDAIKEAEKRQQRERAALEELKKKKKKKAEEKRSGH